MRAWCFLAVLGVIAAGAYAAPAEGSRTLTALREWFQPVTSYFGSLPSKTPSDVASDVKEKVTDVKEWVQENEAIQGLVSSLAPARQWIKEKASAIGDKSFQELYEDVKQRVADLDEKVGTWIQERAK